MEKIITIIVKAVLLVSAGALLIIRLLTYKGFETMDVALRNQLNIIAYIAAGITLISGIAWVLLEKRHPKEKQSYEFIPPDFDTKKSSGNTEKKE